VTLRFVRAVVSLAAALVPAAVRGEWEREWQAELWHRHAQLTGPNGLAPAARLTLVINALGALVHAAWLRKEEWSLAVLLQDVRYAIRGLAQQPAFASIAVAMLALGIGANAAVFSVVSSVLLEPLPYREPDRLVQVWETSPLRNWTRNTVAPANLLDWRARNRSFEGIAYYFGSDTKAPGLNDSTLTGAGEPERVRGMAVSANFFEILGVPAGLGRTFEPLEEVRGRHRVVVLDHGFWRRRFGGDHAIIGREVTLNGFSWQVIGVMPRAFSVPGGRADYWSPMVYDEAQLRSARRPHYLRAIARLSPGVTIDQARSDVVGIMRELEREYPDTNTKMGAGLGPLHEWFVGDERVGLLLLMGAVSLVLLIACANVASLLLARATTRRTEIAIRVALGAGRVRLLRQLLTESLVLAATGALLGVAVAYGAVEWFRANGPAEVPRLDRVSIDPVVLAFTAAMTLLTALLFGVAPAWHSVRSTPADALQDGGRSSTGSGGSLRRILIGAEVALAVVLLVGAGLIARSFANLRAVDPGIDVPGGLSFKIALPSQRYDTPAKIARFYAEALDGIRREPGVQAAGATGRLALEGYMWTSDLYVEGRPEVAGRELRHKSITPGYLAATGIPILRGRDFDTHDAAGGLPVAIVNQTLVREQFPDVDPLGQRIIFGRPTAMSAWRTIVGVAADERQDGLDAAVRPEVYEPHAQDARAAMAIVVRTAGDPLAVLPAVRRSVAQLDASIALYEVRSLAQIVERSLAGRRFATVLLTAFAAGALLLAAVGLYGVIAFSVTSRTKEIGLRLALGASRSSVLTMVVCDGLRVVLMGMAVGIVAAVAMGRGIRAFLFETPAVDPLVLSAVILLLTTAGALASYVPALRAARVDPAVSLRDE
jgi:predicted permease